MTIEKNLNAAELTITLTGRLDTTTAPQLENELKASLPGVESLVLDFAGLDYLSSAGLRVILRLLKAGHKLRMINTSPEVYEVLEVTGFSAMLPVSKACAR